MAWIVSESARRWSPRNAGRFPALEWGSRLSGFPSRPCAAFGEKGENILEDGTGSPVRVRVGGAVALENGD